MIIAPSPIRRFLTLALHNNHTATIAARIGITGPNGTLKVDFIPLLRNTRIARQVGIYWVNLEIVEIAASSVKVPLKAIGITIRALIRMAIPGVPCLDFFAITGGNIPLSAKASHPRGLYKEEATLIPPMDIRVPIVTSISPKPPKNVCMASATGVSDWARLLPSVPIETT